MIIWQKGGREKGRYAGKIRGSNYIASKHCAISQSSKGLFECSNVPSPFLPARPMPIFFLYITKHLSEASTTATNMHKLILNLAFSFCYSRNLSNISNIVN